MTKEEQLRCLKRALKQDTILAISETQKGEVFVETDWYVYVINQKREEWKIRVVWSSRKRPYLMAGIGIVLFLLFFMGGPIAEWSIIGILVGLGLVNVIKSREIQSMKKAILKAFV